MHAHSHSRLHQHSEGMGTFRVSGLGLRPAFRRNEEDSCGTQSCLPLACPSLGGVSYMPIPSTAAFLALCTPWHAGLLCGRCLQGQGARKEIAGGHAQGLCALPHLDTRWAKAPAAQSQVAVLLLQHCHTVKQARGLWQCCSLCVPPLLCACFTVCVCVCCVCVCVCVCECVCVSLSPCAFHSAGVGDGGAASACGEHGAQDARDARWC